MEYNLKSRRDRNLALALVIMLIIAAISGLLAHRLYSDNRALTNALLNNRQLIILPMNANTEFGFVGERGDARYLRLMALSLVNLRLNISSSTAQAAHKLLMAYACEGQEKVMAPALTAERRSVSINEGSSVFYPAKISVNADKGIVDIGGNLQFTYGINEARPIEKHYRIRLDTRNDGLCFNAFVEVSNEQ